MMDRSNMLTNRNCYLVALLLCTGVSCKAILKDRAELGTCGDGIVQSTEDCDPAMAGSSGKCSDQCTTIECGNGLLDPGEQCDNGKANDNNGDCTTQCTSARCGDGFIKTHGTPMSGSYPYEVCDDKNSDNGDGCNPQCTMKGQVSVVAGKTGGKGTTDGAGTSGQFAGIGSLALSDNGRYLYATDHDACTLREINIPSWEVKTRIGAPGECYTLNGVGTAARLSANYQPIAVANTTLYLGSGDMLRAVNLNDWSVTSCAQIQEPHPSDTQITALTFDPDDPTHLYASTHLAIYSVNLPCKCASALALSDCNLEHKLGDPANSKGWITAPQDGMGSAARFGSVLGLAADTGNHRMFVGDFGYIRQVDLDSWQITTVAGSANQTHKDGPGLDAGFSDIFQLAYDQLQDRLYAIDLQVDTNTAGGLIPSWSTVRSYDPKDNQVSTLAGAVGDLRNQPSGELDGFGTSSRFLNARGLAVLQQPNTTPWVLVGEDSSVRVVSTASGQVATPVGTLVEDPLFWSARSITKASVTISESPTINESEIVVATQFGDLMAMRTDGSGPVRTLPSCAGTGTRSIRALTARGSHIYAFDRMAGGICRIDLDGQVGDSCLTGTPETCAWVFKLPIARNWSVGALAYDGTYFYVSDKLAPTLWRINEATGERVAIPVALTNIGWLDALAYVPKPVPVSNGTGTGVNQTSSPGTGWLYATSSLQNQVLRIDLDNWQVHFIGTGTAAHQDGTPTTASFCHPVGLTTDGTRLFVGDTLCDLTQQQGYQGHTIRQIDALGEVEAVSTLLGPGPSHLVESIGAQASVNYPNALTYDDKTGAVFGVDGFDNVIFKVQ